MALPKLSVTGLDNENQRRRLPETINNILDHTYDDFRVQTSAEKLALITPINTAYPPEPGYFLERVGGGTGSAKAADNDAAIVKILSIFAATGIKGGRIQLGRGAYYFNSPISLVFLWGIHICGVGGVSGGAVPGTQLIYTGTGTRFIDMRGALGVFIHDCDITFSNASFTGTLVDVGNDGTHDSFRCGLVRCNVGNSIGTGCLHVDLLQAIEFVADQCHFSYGNPSINGKGSSSYSNVVTFRDCTWTNSYTEPIVHPGEAWGFYGCTFESLEDGTAGAIDSGNSTFPTRGLTIDNCWFGDVSTGGGTWIYASGKGLNVRGCFFGGHATATTCISLESMTGAVIEGNDIDLFSIALNFADANCAAIRFTPNTLANVTSIIGNVANAPNDLNFDFTPNSPNVSAEPTSAAMASYTPAWTAVTTNPTLGNGTISGRYTKRSREVFAHGQLVIGSTTTNGTGAYFISLPFAPSTALPQLGTVYLLDSGTNFRVGICRTVTDGTARMQMIFEAAASAMGPTVPITPATGDELHWSIKYLT